MEGGSEGLWQRERRGCLCVVPYFWFCVVCWDIKYRSNDVVYKWRVTRFRHQISILGIGVRWGVSENRIKVAKREAHEVAP